LGWLIKGKRGLGILKIDWGCEGWSLRQCNGVAFAWGAPPLNALRVLPHQPTAIASYSVTA